MASRVIQFIWTQHAAEGQVSVNANAIVAALTDAEWVVVERVCDWLTRRNKSIVTNVVKTNALGGEFHDLTSTLRSVADHYRYSGYDEDHPVLAEHGIHRAKPEPGA